MKKVLFLCTDNSCRSQIAEAVVNHKVEGWQAFSAGTKPAGYVHPKAIQVLEEVGIRHSGRSKHPDELRDVSFDLVVTVCDSAAEECPLWLGSGKKVHSSFSDPAQASGSEEEVLDEFRRVRDAILGRIPPLLKDI